MKFFLALSFITLFYSCEKYTSPKTTNKVKLYFPNNLKINDFTKTKMYVVGIKDGDSFTAIDSLKHLHEIRLLYIDAPEKFQPYSLVARNFTSKKIFNDSVIVYYKELDQYGRILALVETSEHKILNEELLKNGLAWHFVQYSNDPKYNALEDSARKNNIGIFSRIDAISPWNWRKSH